MAGPSKMDLNKVLTAGKNVSIKGDNKIASHETIIHTQIINNPLASTSSDDLPSKKPRTCCKKLETNQLSCNVLQQELRKFYRHLFLSKIAWLEEERELPIQDYFIDLKLIDSDKPIKIEEIFNNVNEDEKPFRIYIEGQPGYGKTTLANKLANDWALQKEYIGHFKLVFLLPLQEMHGRSIQEVIISIGQHLGLEENPSDIVNHHKNETLFLIDELDEISVEERRLILKTLYELEYSEVTVIVFGRTGIFSLTKNEHKDLFKGANKSRYFHDRNISILGIDTNVKKKEFIKKILPTLNVDKIDKILECLKPNLEIFHSPLFLMLLIIIVSEKETNIGPFGNRTEIYKMLFNSIIKHHLIKSGNNIHTEFDLFQLNSGNNETQSLIQKFGKLSLEKIAKNELQFESNDLTKQIYNCGFLINHKQMTGIRFINYYKAFHLSFLEFASAYALWIDLKQDKTNLEYYILHFLANHRTSLILVFLASLMQDNMDQFISLIKPFSSYFSSAFYITLTLFEDCTSIDWNEKSNIIDFLPSVIDLKGFRKPSNICKHLITHGSKYGKIKYINISEDTNPELIPNLISHNSQIIFQNTSWFSYFAPHVVLHIQIRYTKGHCIARDSVTQLKKLDSLSTREQLNYIALSNTESCMLYLYGLNDKQILKMILEILFQKIKFEHLTVGNLDDNQLQIITTLIKSNLVENLRLINDNCHGDLMNELCGAAGQSRYLTSITVTANHIDLYHLTNGGTKNYHFIDLDNCTLSCSITLKQRNCCHHLKLTKSNNFNEIDAIIEMEPTSLTCNSDLLGYLLRKYPNWKGFNSIKQLCLHQYSFEMKDVDNLCVDKKIVSWNKLKTLYIHVESFIDFEKNFEHGQESDIERDIERDIEEKAIVKCVQMLGIKNFAIQTNLDRVDNLFKCFNEKKICLNKIKLSLPIWPLDLCYLNLDSFSTELLNGIKCNHWMKVNVVGPLKFNEFLINNFINQLKDFNVVHFCYGSRENDDYKLKTQFYPLTLASGTFCITKK